MLGEKLLNKQMVPKKEKPKKEVKAKYTIETEAQLKARTQKMTEIHNDEKESLLEIDYKIGKERTRIKKKYKRCGIESAMTHIRGKQTKERDRLFTLFFE